MERPSENCAELRERIARRIARARARLLLLRPRRHPLADRRAAVLLAQVHLEPRHRLLEHADLLEPRLVEVVDLPILRVVRDAVVGRVRQHEHARLRHLPLVDRRDEDGGEHAAVRARDVRLRALDRRLLLRPVLPPRQRIEHRLQLVDRRRRADRLDAAALRAPSGGGPGGGGTDDAGGGGAAGGAAGAAMPAGGAPNPAGASPKPAGASPKPCGASEKVAPGERSLPPTRVVGRSPSSSSASGSSIA